MRPMVLGMNHEGAGVALRGRVALSEPELQSLYPALATLDGFEGAVVLSTCNRTEIYTTDAIPMADLVRLWSKQVDVPATDFADVLYLYVGREAVRHLFRVAAGLDAMALGETEILGQVKDAYAVAQRHAAAGPLHRIFQAAIRAAKRAHTETAISDWALSLGYAARELAEKIFGENLADRRLLMMGAGNMATNVLLHFQSSGARTTVVNRTPARSRALAERVGADVGDWADLESLVVGADVVVAATKSPNFLVPARWVQQAVRSRRGDPWLFLDLSVPRNISPAVSRVPGVLRYDLDDLRAVVEKNRARREGEVKAVEAILDEEQRALEESTDAAAAGAVIRSLRAKAEGIRAQELEALWRRAPELTPAERRAIERTTHLILTKLLNDPMVSIRSWAGMPDAPVYLATLRDLFRLDDDGPKPVPD